MKNESPRCQCDQCGVHTEALPWAHHGSRFTHPFEEKVAYMAQSMARGRLLAIAWRTVGRIIGRVVEKRLDPKRLKELRHIGGDKFSTRKRHRYITVVVDHEKQRVVWVGEGKGSDTTLDMSAACIKSITEQLPKAKQLFDRFHLAKLASEALDELRRAELRAHKGSDEARTIKGMRFIILSNPWNLKGDQPNRLAELQNTNRRLYRGYLLKEALADALDDRQPKRAREALERWLSWASHSRLEPFIKLARTIRKRLEGILAYVKERQTNARVEGINNRLRMITRRAFGFHSRHALTSMLFLCCGGIHPQPAIPH